MKVELHINGSHQVILEPERTIEQGILRDMVEASDRGRPVKITAELLDGVVRSMTVSVEA